MTGDWARLGTQLAAARKARGYSQIAMAEHIGVKRSAIQNIERGVSRRVTTTMRQYARTVGWDDASIDAVLAGGEPTVAEQPSSEPATAPATAAASAIPLRIVEELGEGPVLDTTVLDLPGSHSGSRMVLVVMGEPDASPEEIRRDLQAWRKTEKALRGLEVPGDDDPSVEGA